MAKLRKRTTETRVYIVLWMIVVALYLLNSMRERSQMQETLLDISVFVDMTHKLLPFAVLFVVNNYLLIPRLLLKNKWRIYFAVTAATLAVLFVLQCLDFLSIIRSIPEGEDRPHPPVRPLIPLPVLLDCVYDLLVVGCNLAIALMFRWFDDKLEKESLMKANAENQLAYLKAQINPHFYMNMLNNIHGLIETHPEKAQLMLIDLSKLMRFMLYDSSKPLIPLAEEIAFLNKYLNLIRQRYPADKVSITSEFPSPERASGIYLPPLLFLVFIENAFKHGISYRQPSYVAVRIETVAGFVRFHCMNSVHAAADGPVPEKSGTGLKNIRRRLELLYGGATVLELRRSDSAYIVNLTIPVRDVKDHDN